MEGQSRRVLILDSDSDTLIALQRVLENAEIDTTITWNEAEARQLIETAAFDLLLIGDHPPELNPAAIIEHLSFRGICPSVLVLQTVIAERAFEYFRKVGAKGVVTERDSLAVLDQVKKVLASPDSKASRRSGLDVSHSLRAAS